MNVAAELPALLFLLLTIPDVVLAQSRRRPNFIVMQPDDLKFFEEWLPPAHFPDSSDIATYSSRYSLPNMDRLRENGITITQA